MLVAHHSKVTDKRMKVLVTGHSGFTRRYVSSMLQSRGHFVVGLGTATEPASGSDDYIQADLLHAEDLRNSLSGAEIDAVVHLAAISFVGHRDVQAIYDVNVVGTRNLLSALAEAQSSHRLKSLILASSANIYGNVEDDAIPESTSPLPENDYAVSKVAMENVARIWSDRLPITILRPFNYTGVGQNAQFLIPKIVSHFARREPSISLGNTEVWRDFSDVRSIARVYADLLDLHARSETYNFCSGNPLSIDDVLAMMTEIAGYEIQVNVNPDFIRANEIRRLAGDPQKLQSVIGEFQIPFKDTLEWMYASAIEEFRKDSSN